MRRRTAHAHSIQMTFINQDQSCFDSSFVQTAKRLSELQQSYTECRNKALHIRMELIGLAEQEKSKYPQRSPEAVYIQEGYKANGWTDDIIKKNKAAWQQYRSFVDNVNLEIQAIAKHSSVSQLYELALDQKRSMWWDAMKYLQRHKQMPTVKQLRGYRSGWTDKQFNFRSQMLRTASDSARPSDQTEVLASPTASSTSPSQSLSTDPCQHLPLNETPQATICSSKAYELALLLQNVVDGLLDIHPQWEGDHRITELVDAQRLSQLTNQLCAGKELGWDF